MTKVEFNSLHGSAALQGSELEHLKTVALQQGYAAWQLDVLDLGELERICQLLPAGQWPRVADLPALVAEARRARFAREYDAPGGLMGGSWGEPTPQWRVREELRMLLRRPRGLVAEVGGVQVGLQDAVLNTALVLGSDPVRLAAKMGGWAESHAWVDGPDRRWLAGVIDEGLHSGVFRRELRVYQSDGLHRTHSQGWEDVTALLRERDDCPVVMSYSVGNGFPDADLVDVAAVAPEVGAAWRPDWVSYPDGPAEWAQMDEASQEDCRREARHEAFWKLPGEQQWDMGMAALRERQPWAQLTPASLGGQMFGVPVTVLDLMATDRKRRVTEAAGVAGF